jgi:PAS domain S-box-containing protein
MAEILGYTEEEMLGRHLFTFMDEAGIEKAKRRLARRRQGQREQHEFEFVRQDGGRINVLMGTSPLMDADGHYQGALASVTDITARKEAERALQRNEARFRAVFEQAAAGIAVALPNGRIVEVNEKLCEILGYSREDLRGRTVHDLTFAQDREKEEQDVQEVLAGKKDEFSVEKRYVHQQGHTVWADVSSNVVRDEHGNIRFVIGVIVDITKRKRAEAQLAQYAADLARSNEEDKR